MVSLTVNIFNAVKCIYLISVIYLSIVILIDFLYTFSFDINIYNIYVFKLSPSIIEKKHAVDAWNMSVKVTRPLTSHNHSTVIAPTFSQDTGTNILFYVFIFRFISSEYSPRLKRKKKNYFFKWFADEK